MYIGIPAVEHSLNDYNKCTIIINAQFEIGLGLTDPDGLTLPGLIFLILPDQNFETDLDNLAL